MMGSKNWVALVLFVLLVFEGYFTETVVSATVTYDHRALVIDGKRRILQSGSFHYPRTTPEVSSKPLFVYVIAMCLLRTFEKGY